METRRVQKTSDGTYFVTLPKSWVTQHGVEKSSLLTFESGRDGKLTIGPYAKQERSFTSATLFPSPTLEREIEEKYLLGYDLIQIESKDTLHSEVRDKAKAILKKLVGLEIVEEDAHKIVIQCLIEPSLLEPQRIIRRLHLITKAMQQDAITAFITCDSKLATTVVERDEEVNRLYFLLVRIVRAALTDLTTAERFHVRSVDCLDYRILASLIEHFGDYSAFIAANIPKEELPKGLTRNLERIGEATNSMYTRSVEAVLSRNLELVSEVANLHQGTLENLRDAERALARLGAESIDKATSVIASLKSMCDIGVDIADLTITR